MQSWIEALRGLRGNPLADYWERHDRALQRRRPWYARHLGLFLFALLLAGAVGYVCHRMSLRLMADPPGSIIAHQHALVYLQVALSLLLLAGVLLLWAWYISRYYECAAACFSLLEPQPRGRLRRSLDDLLAVTSLSEAEVLCGFLRLCLRRLLLPFNLLILGSGVFAALLRSKVLYNPSDDVGPLSIRSTALLLVVLLLTWACGLLAAVSSLLLFISLGAGIRASLLPTLGPLSQIFSQILAAAGYSWLALVADYNLVDMTSSEDALSLGSMAVGLLAASWLLLPLGLYLARRLQWLRYLIGCSVVLPPLLIAMLGRSVEILAGDEGIASGICALAAASLQYTVTPFNTALLCAWVIDRAGLSLAVAALLLPLQMAMLLLLAGFARDAIQRRKWGGV